MIVIQTTNQETLNQLRSYFLFFCTEDCHHAEMYSAFGSIIYVGLIAEVCIYIQTDYRHCSCTWQLCGAHPGSSELYTQLL